jgi:hypothetical protein
VNTHPCRAEARRRGSEEADNVACRHSIRVLPHRPPIRPVKYVEGLIVAHFTTQEFEDWAEAGREREAAEQACIANPISCAVDPVIEVKVNATVAKLLLHALTVGGAGVAALLVKYAGLSGIEAKLAAEVINAIGTAVKSGLNDCINTYYAIGRVSSYRCGFTLAYLEIPVFPYVLFESLKIEDCFYNSKAYGKYDCYTVEKEGWEL